jgi:hypothetical protein
VRARLLLLLFVSATIISRTGKADPLSIEPLVGVSTEYSSNPFLLGGHSRGVNDEAISVDAPIRYDLDSVHYTLLPGVRYSDKGSYSSLDSNYFHLNGTAAYTSDLDTLTVSLGARRDSSLQQYALASNGVGVRADSLAAGASWQRALTERTAIVSGFSFSRALYNEAAAATGLADYRYLSEFVGPQYALSERDMLQLSVSAGQYESLDKITASHTVGAQFGLTHQLTEIWTLSATAGYSKSNNSQSEYIGPFVIGGVVFGPYYLGLAKFVQRGPVFGASVKRTGETMTLTANASRAYTPTGFEYLSRQDSVDVDLNKVLSERWSYTARLSYIDTNTPNLKGEPSTPRYYSGQLSATWHWTAQWMLSLTTTWISARYTAPTPSAQSTGVSLQLSRQFLRTDLY